MLILAMYRAPPVRRYDKSGWLHVEMPMKKTGRRPRT